jgi:hypothetical protein
VKILLSLSVPAVSLVTVVAIAGCSTSPRSLPPTTSPPQSVLTPDHSRGAETLPIPALVPDANFAKATEKINSSGGTLFVPKFGGFSGSVGYPSNNALPGTTITLISSTTDINHAPQPSQGTVVFYLQARLKSITGYVTFNTGTASATLRSSSLLSSKTYSIYAYAFGKPLHGTPYNIGSPKNGRLTFTSPINGGTVPAGVTVTVELDQN